MTEPTITYTNKEIAEVFCRVIAHETIDNRQRDTWQCFRCSVSLKQFVKKGFSNVANHVKICHADYYQKMELIKLRNDGRLGMLSINNY